MSSSSREVIIEAIAVDVEFGQGVVVEAIAIDVEFGGLSLARPIADQRPRPWARISQCPRPHYGRAHGNAVVCPHRIDDVGMPSPSISLAVGVRRAMGRLRRDASTAAAGRGVVEGTRFHKESLIIVEMLVPDKGKIVTVRLAISVRHAQPQEALRCGGDMTTSRDFHELSRVRSAP